MIDDNTELEEADFEVSDVFTMLAHFAPQKHFKLHTYACSSQGSKVWIILAIGIFIYNFFNPFEVWRTNEFLLRP